MVSAFWIGEGDLDEFQKKAVGGMGATESFLLTGPAGSGKTNILLLRAKWLKLKNISNFKIVVFTASLREFFQHGCIQYDLPADYAVTAMQLFRELLAEYGLEAESTGNFEEDRSLLAGVLKSFITDNGIEDIFEALLIDEAQDYTDTELFIFRSLAERLVIAADSRQSIYRVAQTPGLMENLVDGNVVRLKYHYRSGHNICLVADGINKDYITYPHITGECKYDEAARPSSVSKLQCDTFQSQVSEIISKLHEELLLYPGEKIGVFFPRANQVAEFKNSLSVSALPDKDRVITWTLHSSKGWEFRSVHIGGCEALPQMRATQKRLTYTGILRGKTSVSLYYSGSIPGYLESALRVLSPPAADPSFDNLFGV
ncbi:DNA/RNA helicase, superfamily I [Pseudomonas syringae pv. tagetis]|uniref:DNA/RNA helicase, superfamily I n=1 Tax=Pseudomonas syringae pv. tagetis TaxID=129140 RepID=A0A3M3Z574_9PSED|nr:AAA family ATPase [Pseudomonas syringae group genomosp. 7]RMO89877.1 DNA/RNA helicase, superfamily I [Pseudomonas syringae pv. tagetis]